MKPLPHNLSVNVNVNKYLLICSLLVLYYFHYRSTDKNEPEMETDNPERDISDPCTDLVQNNVAILFKG